MIEERDRREIVEDPIAKIRSSSNTNINPHNWIQVPTAIGRANEDSGVGKGENLSAIPQRKGIMNHNSYFLGIDSALFRPHGWTDDRVGIASKVRCSSDEIKRERERKRCQSKKSDSI